MKTDTEKLNDVRKYATDLIKHYKAMVQNYRELLVEAQDQKNSEEIKVLASLIARTLAQQNIVVGVIEKSGPCIEGASDCLLDCRYRGAACRTCDQRP